MYSDHRRDRRATNMVQYRLRAINNLWFVADGKLAYVLINGCLAVHSPLWYLHQSDTYLAIRLYKYGRVVGRPDNSSSTNVLIFTASIVCRSAYRRGSTVTNQSPSGRISLPSRVIRVNAHVMRHSLLPSCLEALTYFTRHNNSNVVSEYFYMRRQCLPKILVLTRYQWRNL